MKIPVEQPTAIYRSAKFRAYPTAAQVEVLDRQMAACRWVYNKTIETHARALQRGVDPPDTRVLERQMIVKLRPTPRGAHLRIASSAALRMAIREADAACRVWRYGKEKRPHWRRAGLPGSMSFYPAAISPEHGVEIRGGHRSQSIRIPKLGWVQVVAHRDLPGRPVRVTIKCDGTGRWWVVIACQITTQHEEATGRIAAVDVGAAATLAWVVWLDVTTGDHGRYALPGADINLAAAVGDLRRLNARLDDFEQGSRRWLQIKQRLARHEARLAARRREAARLAASRILDDADVVVVEDLNLRGLLDDAGANAYRLQNAAMGVLLAELERIAERRCKRVVRAHRYLASSHLCAVCDQRADPMGVRVRQWTCRRCRAHLHRDYNAAVNLLRHTSSAGAPPVDARTRLALAGV